MRLRLEALLLLETVLSEAEGRYAASTLSGVSPTAQHHSLAAVQEDLRQVCGFAHGQSCLRYARPRWESTAHDQGKLTSGSDQSCFHCVFGCCWLIVVCARKQKECLV